MSSATNIEWCWPPGYTGATWNPIVGCKQIASGCGRCYAKSLHDKRHKAYLAGAKLPAQYAKPFEDVQLFPDRLDGPLRRKKPTFYFVNSVSDVFHEDVPFEFVAAMYGVMAACPQHQFCILTKRPKRMREFFEWLESYEVEASAWEGFLAAQNVAALVRNLAQVRPDLCDAVALSMWGAGKTLPLPNVIHGYSAANQADLDAGIADLLATPSALRCLSLEPLIGPVDVSAYIGYKPMHEQGNREDRGVRLSGNSGRQLRDNTDGGSVARAPEAPPRGYDDQQRVQVGEDHEAGDAGHDWSAPPGVAPFPRPNPARPDGQPQERDQARQQAGELGANDVLGANPPRGARSQGGAGGEPRRREEPQREASGAGGQGDSQATRSRREPDHVSQGVRRLVPDGLQGGAGGPVGIHQIIVGGESGPGARPCDVVWIRSIVAQCKAASVPCFVKQVGSRPTGWGGISVELSDRKGADPTEWPADLRVRKFPEVQG